ncbi:MAG TPA: hypothetical protein ENO20_12850 [Bacteroides sp.]|nr:hypothetical protein [Bacteroides sp.]
MEEHENLYEKIREMLGGNPGGFSVLEHQIDMDLQMEYYACSRKLNAEVDEAWALDQMQYLVEPGYSTETKKQILARLATIKRVECYRAIESYLEEAEESLRDWTLLSLNESRMQMESSLLDESQVFISTGLGGKEKKLRYFLVLISRKHTNFTPTQKKVIQNEFEFVLKRHAAEIEEIRFSGYLSTMLLLIPIHHSLKLVLQEAINECNQYGDFLTDHFIVTNVRMLSFEEIKDFIEKKSE